MRFIINSLRDCKAVPSVHANTRADNNCESDFMVDFEKSEFGGGGDFFWAVLGIS